MAVRDDINHRNAGFSLPWQAKACVPIRSFTPKLRIAATLLLGLTPHLLADSNIRADHAEAWSANTGWLNWRSDASRGVEIGQFICAGNVYAANFGWISLGNGRPANGIQYQNNSSSDFGVNVDSSGALRGLAYGANVGWISFVEAGAPQVDPATGHLSGSAYGANIGWLNLGDAKSFLAIDSISPGADSDQDGIPDAWELLKAGNLTTFNATSDFDQDGQSDLAEYLADTDPVDPEDSFRIVEWALSPDGASATVAWTSKVTRQYHIEIRSQFDPDTAWSDSGLGMQVPDGQITRRTVPLRAAPAFLQIQAVRPLSP
jgi:hypothetical protein